MPTSVTPTARLAEPLHFPISGRIAKNRLMLAAMSEAICSYADDLSQRGIPGPDYIELYRIRGQGGWGQILTGNLQVDPAHLETQGNSVIPVDAPFSGPRFEAFSATAKAAKENGSLLVAQISHPGRQVRTDVNPNPISASAVQLINPAMGEFGVPRAATQEDIDGIIEAFAHAAEYLEKAGFDGVELHGAHGYLLAQFFSQTTNKRTDKYGGSITNRARLAVEVASAIHKRTSSSFIVGIKLNSVEFQAGGVSPEEAAELVQALEQGGFDYFELSGGTYENMKFAHTRESTRKREAFFIEFAETITSACPDRKAKMYITGGFQTAAGMASALDVVDGVGMARAGAADPAIAAKIVSGEAKGVHESAVTADDGLASLIVARTQIIQTSKGEPLLDSSKPENVKAILEMISARA